MMQIICQTEKPQRIDKWLSLSQMEKGYSRSRIAQLFDEKKVLVNGESVKKSYIVSGGEKIEFDLPEPEICYIEGEDIPLDIIYEDEYLAVINKPAGLVVHPGAGTKNGTLVNALVHHWGKNLSSGSSILRPGIVHRLDKDTSGLMLVARDDRIHYLLSEQFLHRKVTKKYLAITCGTPPQAEGEIRTFMGRSCENRKKMSNQDEGRPAISFYRILQYYNHFAVLEVDIKTGRTHQIRVHLASIHCPVLADNLYNNQKRTLNSIPVEYRKRIKFLLKNHLRRQALHAWKLGFIHPVRREKMEFIAPVPADIQKAINFIRDNFA
jgi:23S rRNA pseudouridine1911/1915/1917 synthase